MSRRIFIKGIPIAESALHTRRTILSRGIQSMRRINTLACIPIQRSQGIENLTDLQSGIQYAEDKTPVSPRSPSITCKASRRWILPVCESNMVKESSYQPLA